MSDENKISADSFGVPLHLQRQSSCISLQAKKKAAFNP